MIDFQRLAQPVRQLGAGNARLSISPRPLTEA
jgi:hypothetical protein